MENPDNYKELKKNMQSDANSTTMSKQEYFDALEKWLNQMKFVQRINNCFPYYLMANYPQIFNNNNNNSSNTESSLNNPSTVNGQNQTEHPNEVQGSDYESTIYLFG